MLSLNKNKLLEIKSRFRGWLTSSGTTFLQGDKSGQVPVVDVRVMLRVYVILRMWY